MTRIDELQKQYPTIPREVIVKWEVLSRGVRDTDDLDKISSWRGATGSYQFKRDEVTLKEYVERRPSRAKDGRVLRPGALLMKTGIGAGLHISPRSPYEIREIGEGKFGLFEGEEKVDIDIYFPRSDQAPGGPERLTSKGTPVSRLLTAGSGSPCFFIVPVHHCEYFSLGDQCKFCNFNPSQDDARSVGLNRPMMDNLEDVLEAYKIRSSEVRLVEGKVELGGFANAEHEERIHYSFVEKVANAAPYKPNLAIATEAMSKKGLQRLKDAGLDAIMIQLEVWEPHLFAEILPGKAQHSSYERWREFILEAVDILGAGNVAVNTEGGLTLMPPNGHKTWQEGRDSHIEFLRSMIENGVIPGYDNLGLAPNSVYGADKANLEKLPPAEYYIDLAIAQHQAMTEHGLYQKINKFLYCGLSGGTGRNYGELGILALGGGTWANWMADVVPEEVNWIRRFIQSVGSSGASAGGVEVDC